MTLSEDGNSFGDLHFLELYQKSGGQPNILFQSNDIESILMMVAAEEGISILPSFVTSKITNGDNLKFIPLEGPEEFVDIYALWKKNRKKPDPGTLSGRNQLRKNPLSTDTPFCAMIIFTRS